jgi:hypothetical protein
MAHYILDDGPFRRAFTELQATGWKLNLESAKQPAATRGPSSKTKFTCPSCGWNVWGKPDTGVFCKPCWIATGGRLIELRAHNVATVPAVESYEQRAA